MDFAVSVLVRRKFFEDEGEDEGGDHEGGEGADDYSDGHDKGEVEDAVAAEEDESEEDGKGC